KINFEGVTTVQGAFFRMFVTIFQGYAKYLVIPTENNPCPQTSFRKTEFLQTHTSSSHAFLKLFLDSQAFQSFAEQRIYTTSDDAHVLFFEESIVSMTNRSIFGTRRSTPFLNDRSYRITKTFVTYAPDRKELEKDKIFRYSPFPYLNPELFSKPRVVPKITGPAEGGDHLLHRRAAAKAERDGGLWQSKSHTIDSRSLPSLSRSRMVRTAAQARELALVRGERLQDALRTAVYSVWFQVYTAILVSNQEDLVDEDLKKTKKQGLFIRPEDLKLNDAFDVLNVMERRGIKPEEGVFHNMIDACAYREAYKLGMSVLPRMQRWGYVPTNAQLLQLAQQAEMEQARTRSPSPGNSPKSSLRRLQNRPPTPPRSSVSLTTSESALTKYHSMRLSFLGGDSSATRSPAASPSWMPNALDQLDRVGSYSDTKVAGTGSFTFSTQLSPKASPLAAGPPPTSSRRPDWGVGGEAAQQRFASVFPEVRIRVKETCPGCSMPMDDGAIRRGWSGNMNDYTTGCPNAKCGERFAPRFTLYHSSSAASKDSSPTGRRKKRSPRRALSALTGLSSLSALAKLKGGKPPVRCEYLSPLVLKKEMQRTLESKGVGYVRSGKFRLKSKTLFWNLLWHFVDHRLPVFFLLPKTSLQLESRASSQASSASRSHHSRHSRHLSSPRLRIRIESPRSTSPAGLASPPPKKSRTPPVVSVRLSKRLVFGSLDLKNPARTP
ncbi:hypothetical protein AAMO2058_001699800, partial [Amorphochlora amoebiformis]